jgi:hypothetical protein
VPAVLRAINKRLDGIEDWSKKQSDKLLRIEEKPYLFQGDGTL